MITFLVRRVFIMIPTVVLISVISFLVIDLPPGDLASSYVARLEHPRRSSGTRPRT